MKKYEICKVKGITYEPSESIEMQGKREKVIGYLKRGYYVKEERNGYWVLVKPSQVMVMVKSSAGVQEMNMKQDILDYYGKKRISEKRVEKFVEDIKKEKVQVGLHENGSYFIKAAS